MSSFRASHPHRCLTAPLSRRARACAAPASCVSVLGGLTGPCSHARRLLDAHPQTNQLTHTQISLRCPPVSAGTSHGEMAGVARCGQSCSTGNTSTRQRLHCAAHVYRARLMTLSVGAWAGMRKWGASNAHKPRPPANLAAPLLPQLRAPGAGIYCVGPQGSGVCRRPICPAAYWPTALPVPGAAGVLDGVRKRGGTAPAAPTVLSGSHGCPLADNQLPGWQVSHVG